MSVDTKLIVEIEDELDKLGDLEFGSEKYCKAIDGITKLYGKAIEDRKIDIDCEAQAAARESERVLREQQMRDERRDRIVKNIIGAAGVVLPLAVTIWGTTVSLKFEETGTVTTQAGRNFVQRLFHKK